MNLTTEEQRTLTEWLGECFDHEEDENPFYFVCAKCGKNLNTRLDFTDWRVVGRLLCQLENVSPLFASAFGHDFFYTPPEYRAEYVCRTVLAWLKEEGR